VNLTARGGSRLSWVPAVEFFNETASRDVGEWFPRIIRIGITFPLDKVLKTILDTTGVQDILDFKVFMVVLDVERRWGWRKTVGIGNERGWFNRVEERDMENVIDMAHRRWKIKLVGL